MNNSRVLITGGAGFIGSRLSLALKARGYQITVMDNLSTQIHGDSSPLLKSIEGHVCFIRGDVRSRDDWMAALDGQDAVIHLAAETGTGQSMYEIERYIDVNIRGTSLLLDILAKSKHSVRKLIVASSRAVYGEGKYNCDKCGVIYPTARLTENMERKDFNVKCPSCFKDADLLPTDEESKLHPGSIYGISKLTQEQMIITAGKSLGIPSVAFRYQNVYGPGQSLSNPYTGILSIFSTRIKNGNPVLIFEDGKESRDFVFIDDVVDATVLGLEKPEADYEVFNVGSGVRTNVITVAQQLINAYKSNVSLQLTGNFRLGDIRDNFADLSKIQAKLGFVPKVDFSNGIRQFSDWVNTREIAQDAFDKSIEEMKLRGLYK